MHKAFEHELLALGGEVACVAWRRQPLHPEPLYELQPSLRFPAASLAKLPILAEIARQVARGQLTWETPYAVPDSMRVTSDGVLTDLSSQLRPTLADVAYLMITISDNTAANMLLDLAGMEQINAYMVELGLQQTRLERRFMDFTARQQGRDNWTCAADMARLLAHFCSDDAPEGEHLLRILLRQNDYTILPAYWEEELPFAHKTGGLVGVMHDAGILYPPLAPSILREAGKHPITNKDPLILVALTNNQRDIPRTRYTLARLGKLIQETF
ncbi:serine hydrolase [Ktedonospora formicarum]|uniref:Beta-lactamase class A catalytic domain-containing protein n=1 Tax=Ktedonospora formicarum TaxID=2778364 RepID=A0A8J3HTZ9_9CHLR|nr:serine hydrolase [Ktedonospora formicarum]GHO43694.1 hypothetical protein KSX_18570 [Ktedonospora formicarum]